jgi:hypothetical protein
MERIGGEQGAPHAERLDQGRHGRNLVGGVADLLVRQDQGGLAGEGAQHVRRRPVVQMVEAAPERLAVERDDARPGRRRAVAQGPGVPAEGGLQRGRIERLEQGAHGVDGRRAAEAGAEGRVEALAMHADEHPNAAVGGGAGQDGQHREEQQVGERVALALAAAWVRDLLQGGEQASERHHDGLRHGRGGAGPPLTGHPPP